MGREARCLGPTKPQDIDPRVLVTMLREATKLERENRVEIVRESDPERGSAESASTLADVISEAWERRRNGDTDK